MPLTQTQTTQSRSRTQENRRQRSAQQQNRVQQPAQGQQTQEGQNKPGFFRRVWNWIKGAFSRLFSRRRNTQTESGGDAAQMYADTQVTAPAPDPVLHTLSPEQTGPAVQQAAASEAPQATAGPQSAEGAQAAEGQQQEAQEEGAAQAPNLQEGDSLTLGAVALSLETRESEGSNSFVSKSGTARVLGQQADWTSEQGIRISCTAPGEWTADGVMELHNDHFRIQNVLYHGRGGTQSFSASENAQFHLFSGGMDLSFQPSGGLGELAELTGEKVTVERPQAAILGGAAQTFENGTIHIAGERDIKLSGTSYPLKDESIVPQIFKAEEAGAGQSDAGAELALEMGAEGAPELAIKFLNRTAHLGAGAIQVVSATPFPELRAPVDEAGAAHLTFPANTYQLRLFGGAITQDLPDIMEHTTLTLGQDTTLSEIEFHPNTFTMDGFTFQDLTLQTDPEGKLSAEVGSLSALNGRLTASHVAAAVTADGVDLDDFLLAYGGGESDPMHGVDFALHGFHLGADGLQFQEAKTALPAEAGGKGSALQFVDGTAILRKQAGGVDLRIHAAARVRHQGDFLFFDNSPVGVTLLYTKPGAAASAAGQAGAAPSGGDSTGLFTMKMSGQIAASVRFNGAEMAKLCFEEGISYKNGTLTLGDAEAEMDLDAAGLFTAKGRMVAQQVSVGPAGVKTGNLMIYGQNPTLLGQSLGESLHLTYNPAEGLNAELPLPEKVKWNIGDAQFTLKESTLAVGLPFGQKGQQGQNQEGGGLSIGLSGGTVILESGDNTISAELEEWKLGGPLAFQQVLLKNKSIASAAERLLGVKDFQLGVTGLTIAPKLESITFQGIRATMTTDISLFHSPLKLTGLSITAKTPNPGSLAVTGVSIGGTLKYEGGHIIKSVGGTLSVGLQKDAQSGSYGLSFEEVSDVSVAVRGYGTGSIKSIEADEAGNGYVFKEVSIKKESDSDSDSDSDEASETPVPEDGPSSSLLKKMVAAAPKVEFLAEEIRYGKGGFTLDPSKILISSVENEITISKELKLALGYQRSNREISATLTGAYYLPAERKTHPDQMKQLLALKLSYPVLPPVITVEFGPFLEAGLDFNGSVGVKWSTGSFAGALSASCHAGVAAGLEGGVRFGLPGANASILLEGKCSLTASGNVDGKIGVRYDSSKPTLRDAISLDLQRDATYFKYDFKTELNFDVNVKAALKVPSVFRSSDSTLMKSWNLFHYNLGTAAINGNIYYENGIQFDGSVSANFNKPGAFNFDAAKQKLEELTTSVDRIKADNQKVCELLDAYPDALGLGDVRDTMRLKQSIVILDMLHGSMREAADHFREVREQLKKLRKALPKVVEKDQRARLIREDIKQAAKLAGVYDEEKKETKSWEVFVQEQREKSGVLGETPNEDYINQLARMDPLAVFNVFRAYKSYYTKNSWKAEYEKAVQLSKQMREQERDPQLLKQKEKTKAQKKQEGLLKNHLVNVNALVDDQFRAVKKSNGALLKRSMELDALQSQQEAINQEDLKLVQEIEDLSQAPAPAAASGATGDTAQNDRRLKLEKRHRALQEKIVELSKQRADKEKEVAAARETSQQSARNAGEEADYDAIQSSFAAVQDQLINEKASYDQNQAQIEADRTDENRDAAVENNKAFVLQLLQKLTSGTPDGGKKPVDAATQEKQEAKVKKRTERVMQGEAAEKRMRGDFPALANQVRNPAQDAEAWKKMHDDYFQRSLDFEEQYKEALDLYYRLVREPFKNEDVGNQAKVKEQNKLLQETCNALNGDLAQVKTIEKEQVEDLNQKVAELQKEANNP